MTQTTSTSTATSTNYIPNHRQHLVPGLIVKNATEAIEFYKKALGAEERNRLTGPDGKSIMHAELKIGDAIFFLTEENPQMKAKSAQSLGGSPITLNVYVPDVDTAFRKAIDSGGKQSMPVADQFWGDRYGSLTDPFGYSWGLATHKEDLSEQELGKRAHAFFASQGAQKKSA
jgi:PhnB protein